MNIWEISAFYHATAACRVHAILNEAGVTSNFTKREKT